MKNFFLALVFTTITRRKAVAAFCLVIITISLSSCFLNFYRTNTTTGIDNATFRSIQKAHKYFIVHLETGVQGLEDVSLKNDTLRGLLVPLPLEHSKHLEPKIDRNNRVKKRDRVTTLMEVHLYADNLTRSENSRFVAPVSKISRMDVYELNRGATTANHIISTAGVVAGAAYIVAVISLAIACNCPHVYVADNGHEQFANGLYSGAIYSTLERTDYLPLPSLSNVSDTAQLKIANAEKEEQFINNVQLLQVNHTPVTKVLADRHGNILSYQKAILPLQAFAGKNHDVRDLLNVKDGEYFSFDNDQNENGFSSVLLTFKKPLMQKKLKLVINARNSKWAGYVHEEFVSMFGESYSKWTERQEKADPKLLNKWQTDQALPLMAYIKTKKGWQFIDFFPLIGNMANRDLIMELDVPDINTTELIIKLETTFRFWDIDFAAVDFNEDKDMASVLIEPTEAVKSDGTDQRMNLVTKDSIYSHLINTESINFKFLLPVSPTANASYFLISGGYYHNLRQYTGKANTFDLYKFRKKGAFDKYSRTKYSSFQRQVLAITREMNQTK